MLKTRIKMCGTTNIDDALKAVECGVDALGFIFVPESPRYITPEAAIGIVRQLPPLVFKIGVFVNESSQEVEEIVHYLGLNGVQLHGEEDPEYCENLGYTMPSCALIKAFRVGEHTTPSDFSPYNDVTNGFLLDTYEKDKAGGTGKSFNWQILESLSLQKPVILAGGLTPENIGDAIEAVVPYAVDVNSGIEHAPGVKDHIRLERFVHKVMEYDRQAD